MGSGRVFARRANWGVRGLPRGSLSIYLSGQKLPPRNDHMHISDQRDARGGRAHSVQEKSALLACLSHPRAFHEEDEARSAAQ